MTTLLKSDAQSPLNLNDNDRWFAESFQGARSAGRRIVAYLGPTNSGKTYHAFKHFENANTGVYLGPLRLLAHEGYERLQSISPNSCALITGEERIGADDARFVSSTIEMLNPQKYSDVVVVDEVQMFADPHRGSAWWQALIGANCQLLVLAGSADAEPVLRALFAWLGESIEFVFTERKTPLSISPVSIGLDFVSKKSAVVAFSRRDIVRLKIYFDEKRVKTALIYGNLSPEVRREEARRFREGEADVLLTTDAIAMGLNLPIDHVHFYTVCKYDGTTYAPVDFRLIQQIAGRAGRFGYAVSGKASAMSSIENKYLALAMERVEPFGEQKVAYMPSSEHVYKNVASGRTLAQALVLWARTQPESDALRAFVPSEMLELARVVDSLGMLKNVPFDVIWSLILAPIDPDIHEHDFRDLCINVRDHQHCTHTAVNRFPLKQSTLKHGEIQQKWLNVYRWLHYRHPVVFPDIQSVNADIDYLNQEIERVLRLSYKATFDLPPAKVRDIERSFDDIQKEIKLFNNCKV